MTFQVSDVQSSTTASANRPRPRRACLPLQRRGPGPQHQHHRRPAIIKGRRPGPYTAASIERRRPDPPNAEARDDQGTALPSAHRHSWLVRGRCRAPVEDSMAALISARWVNACGSHRAPRRRPGLLGIEADVVGEAEHPARTSAVPRRAGAGRSGRRGSSRRTSQNVADVEVPSVRRRPSMV